MLDGFSWLGIFFSFYRIFVAFQDQELPGGQGLGFESMAIRSSVRFRSNIKKVYLILPLQVVSNCFQFANKHLCRGKLQTYGLIQTRPK